MAAVSVMPFGGVIEELQRGEITRRRITGGQFVRTLYLVGLGAHPSFMKRNS